MDGLRSRTPIALPPFRRNDCTESRRGSINSDRSATSVGTSWLVGATFAPNEKRLNGAILGREPFPFGWATRDSTQTMGGTAQSVMNRVTDGLPALALAVEPGGTRPDATTLHRPVRRLEHCSQRCESSDGPAWVSSFDAAKARGIKFFRL